MSEEQITETVNVEPSVATEPATEPATESAANIEPATVVDAADSSEPQQEPTPTSEQEPDVAPAHAAEGGREVSNKILYVANLTKNITEETLIEFFDVNKKEAVSSVKILIDKNRLGFNYAFVEFVNDSEASAAFESLSGSALDGAEITINWAYQSQQSSKDQDLFNVFVGDLATDVNDEFLKKAFERFASLVQAHVMWDMQTGRSRGYGFVSFSDEKDAEEAIQTMNGELIAGRAVRLNWASHKLPQQQQQHHQYGNGHHHNNGYRNNSNHHHHHNNGNNNSNSNNNNNNNNNGYRNNYHSHHSNYQHIYGNGNVPNQQSNGQLSNDSTPSAGSNASTDGLIAPQTFEAILRKTPTWLTTVYIGNLAHYTTQNDLVPLLQTFGYIVDLKFYPEKGCAFVKYDSHDRAALAIAQLQGLVMNGRPLKSGWGKGGNNNHHHHHHNAGQVQAGQGVVPNMGQYHPGVGANAVAGNGGLYGGMVYQTSQGR
ncbi:hypothetical protein WICPIJ_008791 [Wickerhamomyces pijperi]|uniref:RRM domain-containing protein n=1 Tax=Wickerhamomyces pijperi TaxID=599730 RepID=A0A9P8TGN9_WICPI|nr:hypothetical protein WICPIJ_008791 [Wickerhamomyces pijperi]